MPSAAVSGVSPSAKPPKNGGGFSRDAPSLYGVGASLYGVGASLYGVEGTRYGVEGIPESEKL